MKINKESKNNTETIKTTKLKEALKGGVGGKVQRVRRNVKG